MSIFVRARKVSNGKKFRVKWGLAGESSEWWLGAKRCRGLLFRASVFRFFPLRTRSKSFHQLKRLFIVGAFSPLIGQPSHWLCQVSRIGCDWESLTSLLSQRFFVFFLVLSLLEKKRKMYWNRLFWREISKARSNRETWRWWDWLILCFCDFCGEILVF